MPKKELGNMSDFLAKVEEPNVETAVGKNQNVDEIFPNNMDMAGDGSKNWRRREKHRELNTVSPEKKTMCEDLVFNRSNSNNNLPLDQDSLMSSQVQIDSPNSSLSSESSFVFIEPERSVPECECDNLKEECDASLKAELGKKILTLDSGGNFTTFFIEPQSENNTLDKDIPSIPNPMKSEKNRRMMIRTFVGENRSISAEKHSDVNGGNQVNSTQKHDETLLLTGDEDQMKELREALEHSTNCLLRCLEKLQNKPLKHEELNSDECNWIPKHDRNTFKCESSKNNFMTNNQGIGDIISNSSVSTSHTIKNNLVDSVKQSTEVSMTPVSRCSKEEKKFSKGIQINFENCDCDCCNGRCRHPQRNRRNFDGNLSKDVIKPKTKVMPNVLKKEDFSRGIISNKEVSPNKAKKNTANPVCKPNAANALTFKNEKTSRKRTNNILKYEDCGRKNDTKSKIVAKCAKIGEQEKHEEIKTISEDDEDDSDLVQILFITFLAFFGFLLYMFFFI